MKTRFTVLVYPRRNDLQQVERLVERIGRQYLIRGSAAYYQFAFPDHNCVADLYELASHFGFTEQQLSTRKEYAYTRSEKLAAPLLWLSVTREPEGEGGPSHGTQFDLRQACGKCGSGAKQTSPLVLNRPATPMREHIIETLDGEILISEELVAEFRRVAVTGAGLWQAVARDSSILLPWYQIVPETEMPPMSRLTRGIIQNKPCPECFRDGHFHEADQPIEIVYDRGSMRSLSLPDVVRTYECFGNSVLREPVSGSHFAQPLILIKSKVLEIFEKYKVRGVEFIPVKIVDQ